MLFTDTVGFIQKLPHHLVQAFRATLEEVCYADILVHVVDGTSAVAAERMAVVYETLRELGCGNKPVITLYNKRDAENFAPPPQDANAVKTLPVSAKNGDGMADLLAELEERLKHMRKKIAVLIPYADGHMNALIYGKAEILAEEHREDGTYFELYADDELSNRLLAYGR